MIRALTALLFAALTATPVVALDCRATLTGKWEAKGDTKFGNMTMTVDHLFVYGGDGTFEARQRWHTGDGVWQQQEAAGQWTATSGDKPNTCVVEMLTRMGEASSSSTSTVTIVDQDTFRSMGFDTKRVK